MKQLLGYAQLVRLPNTFTAMADICLGGLATGMLLNRWPVFVCLLLASTLLYWSGMIWNDFFDLSEDRRDRPSRPLASGRVSLRGAIWLGVGCLLGGVLLAALADLLAGSERWISLWIAVALVIVIFAYDSLGKQTWAGPFLMGGCRLLNVLLGLTILGSWPPAWGWLLAIIVGTYIAGVTWLARTETALSSKPMLIGAAIVILISLLLALTVPALALEITAADFQPSMLFTPLLAAFGASLGLAVLRAIRHPVPGQVQSAIKRAILGLVVLDALLASAFVGSAGLLLILLLLPGLVLGRWLYST
jgi:4-hydroxybenzoate polyprenyltransferase